MPSIKISNLSILGLMFIAAACGGPDASGELAEAESPALADQLGDNVGDILANIAPPDIALQIQTPVPNNFTGTEAPSGCLGAFETSLVVQLLRTELAGQGIVNPDIRSSCALLDIAQPVPGFANNVKRTATKVGVWEDQDPSEDVLRTIALNKQDLIRGFESFYPIIAMNTRGAFMQRQAEVALAAIDDIELEDVDVLLDNPVDQATTRVDGKLKILGLPIFNFTVGLVEKLRIANSAGELLCDTDVNVTDGPENLIENRNPVGALCTVAGGLFLKSIDQLQARIAYVDFAITSQTVSARGAIGGLAISGPGFLVLDPRAPAPATYRADLFSNANVTPGLAPHIFQWSVDQGSVQSPAASQTRITFDLGGDTGSFVRTVTLTVTDARGVKHTMSRAINIRSAFISGP